jgi:hypothetical protein
MATMNSRRAHGVGNEHPCQRPGCPRKGKPRLQKRDGSTRTLYLCADCLGWLRPFQLNELFRELGVPGSVGPHSPKALPATQPILRGPGRSKKNRPLKTVERR